MLNKKMKIFAILAGLVTTSAVFAQGLEGIKPDSDSKEAKEAEEKANEAKEKASEIKEALDASKKEEKKPEKKIERSELSKKLDGKLKVGTAGSMALSMSGPSGTYTGGGTGEVFFLYNLDKKVAGFDLFASGRYAPVDFTAVIDDQAYRGVLDNYQAGVSGEKSINSKIRLVVSSELSYQINWLDSIDGQVMPDGTDENGFGLNIAGSAIWTGFEGKLSYGPKLGYTAGSYSFATLGGEINFLF